MINKTIRMTLLLLLMQSSVFILGKDQTIEVVNSSDATLTLEHGVPEYTKAFIALKKIDPLQYQLNRAILNDSPEEIRAAVKAGANIHPTKIGKAPLLIAVLLRRTKAVDALLKCGATIKSDHESDNILIEYATKLGDFESAYLLLNKWWEYEHRDERRLPHAKGLFVRLLKQSLIKRNPKASLYLLKQSPTFFGKHEWIINKSTGKKEWSLKEAISMGEIFELFHNMSEKEGIDINIFMGIIQDLIDHGYEVDSVWNEPKANSGYKSLYTKEILYLFLKNGANPNHKIGAPCRSPECLFTYPIFRAIESGNKEAVEALVDNGAYLDQTTNTHQCGRGCHGEMIPLAIAINHGLADIVELLVSHDAKL